MGRLLKCRVRGIDHHYDIIVHITRTTHSIAPKFQEKLDTSSAVHDIH